MAQKSYAHRDVLDKLGIVDGARVRAVGPVPGTLLERVEARPGVTLAGGDDPAPVDVILFRLTPSDDPGPALAGLKRMIVAGGGIWVLTAKRGRPGYVPQPDLIPLGEPAGLVDNKVCSVDDETSAIRFVIPRDLRADHVPEGA